MKNEIQDKLNLPDLRWQDLYGNKYSMTPTSAMLKGKGYSTARSNNAKTKDLRVFGMVTYDRAYVEAWLSYKFFSGFDDVEKYEMLALLENCYQYHCFSRFTNMEH